MFEEYKLMEVLDDVFSSFHIEDEERLIYCLRYIACDLVLFRGKDAQEVVPLINKLLISYTERYIRNIETI